MGEEGGGGDPAAKLRGTGAMREGRNRHGLHGRGQGMRVGDVKK